MPRETIEERRLRLMPGALWLRAERESRGWSGSELARRMTAMDGGVKVAQERISAYERAQDEPPAEFARTLARVLELPEIQVWQGLRKPLPRELDTSSMSDEEVVAYVKQRFPGAIEAILRNEPAPTATEDLVRQARFTRESDVAENPSQSA